MNLIGCDHRGKMIEGLRGLNQGFVQLVLIFLEMERMDCSVIKKSCLECYWRLVINNCFELVIAEFCYIGRNHFLFQAHLKTRDQNFLTRPSIYLDLVFLTWITIPMWEEHSVCSHHFLHSLESVPFNRHHFYSFYQATQLFWSLYWMHEKTGFAECRLAKYYF